MVAGPRLGGRSDRGLRQGQHGGKTVAVIEAAVATTATQRPRAGGARISAAAGAGRSRRARVDGCSHWEPIRRWAPDRGAGS